MERKGIERVWARVVRGDSDSCWEWHGAKVRGHGVITIDKTPHRVHRLVYESEVGAIPDRFDVHHVCNNRACVNPAHLQALSRREHALATPNNFAAVNAAKTHCPRGHAYAGDNLIVNKNGSRVCRACGQAAGLRWKHRHLPMQGARRGDRHPHATLTEDAVREIRSAYAAGGVSQAKLGEQYGVGVMQINRIVNRKQWTHVA